MRGTTFRALTKGLEVTKSKTLTYVHFTDPAQVSALVSILREENISYSRKNKTNNCGHISLRTKDIDTYSDLADFILQRK